MSELKSHLRHPVSISLPVGGGGGGMGYFFSRYVPLASQSPYSIMVYSVAKYRSHLSHFWENVIQFAIPI